MNVKSLNKEELEYLFTKFKDFPNINEMKFLGKISKLKSRTGLSNPNYTTFIPNNDASKQFTTARIMIEIPSPFRVGANNLPYITKIPLFTSDAPAIACKEEITEEIEYLVGFGKIQNYKVVLKNQENKDLMDYLETLIMDRLQEKPEKIKEVAKVLHLYSDKKDSLNFMKLTNVWTNNFSDGTDIAKQKIEEGEIPQINQATIQGLVYMPPSLRTIKVNGEDAIHFKVRIKREKDEGMENQNVPTMYQADYDYINVIGFGKQTENWFMNLKQGYPVRVEGRLESSKFRNQKRVTDRQKNAISSILGIDITNPFFELLDKYFKDNNIQREFPNYNIWANKVITDF